MHDGSGGLRSQFDRVNAVGVTALRHDRLTCGAEVADPADLAKCRLHEPPITELHHRDWRAAPPAARAATHGEKHVGPSREPDAKVPAEDGVEKPDRPRGVQEYDREQGHDDGADSLAHQHIVGLPGTAGRWEPGSEASLAR